MATRDLRDLQINHLTGEPIRAVQKPPRPPHVIALSDAISETSKHQQLGALLVAWYDPAGEDGEQDLRIKTIGPDDAIIGLAERVKWLTVIGGGEVDLPSDS